MSTLRDYQGALRNGIYAAWNEGARAVLATMATGGGKTVVFSSVLNDFNAPAVLIAHRSELVAQAALALNRERVPHSIIAPRSTVNEIVRLEHDTHGHSSFAWRAPVRVAGVDTLIRDNEPWHASVALNVIDEGHHVLRDNKWGKCAAKFPNARLLGVTAHAVRADGQGLGRHADGLFDRLVVGPHGRALIDRGFLTDYRMLIPPTDVDFSDVKIGATGDYSAPQLRAATHRAKRLVGDIVQHYIRAAPGKLGLTFAVDIDAANELCNAYRKADVPAEIITGNTSIPDRARIMRDFRARRILQLVSVDVLGEGTDVPAVEVVSLGRRTASWQLMCQQIGRALRTDVAPEFAARWGEYTDEQRRAIIAASNKPKAIILDHVGNLLLHHDERGLPDSEQTYSLDRRAKVERAADLVPLRSCMECFQPYERFRVTCPYCGSVPLPQGRETPQQVDGDLVELDPAALQKISNEVARINGVVRLPHNVFPHVAKAIENMHFERQVAQAHMRNTAALWGGYYHAHGETDREIQKRFYLMFGVDVLTAQSLNRQDAIDLQAKITSELQRLNVTGVTT